MRTDGNVIIIIIITVTELIDDGDRLYPPLPSPPPGHVGSEDISPVNRVSHGKGRHGDGDDDTSGTRSSVTVSRDDDGVGECSSRSNNSRVLGSAYECAPPFPTLFPVRAESTGRIEE